jgi:LPXTG-motif cell wall-anchored protein
MANRWLKRATAAAAAVGLTLVFGGGTAWAASSRGVVSAFTDGTTVVWNGNGTNEDGTCKNVGSSDDLDPSANQEGWVFILTHPAGDTSDLTFDFNPDAVTPSPVAGDKKGNGSIHFVVYTPIGAALQTAQATNGTADSVLTVSHCEDGSKVPPTPESSLTSEVHLANHTVIDDSSNPGTAPADVHDQVTLTVTGVDFWSGKITENFYKNNECQGYTADHTTFDVDQSTTMPLEDLLPEPGLAEGEYSYQATFVDVDDDTLSVEGACEPFKIVDAPSTTVTTTPPTTTSTAHLPVTGSSLTGILVAGVALIAAGGATLFLLRRRRATEGQ